MLAHELRNPLSRITTGKLALQRRRCELRDVVQSAIDTARPRIDAREHTLCVVLPDEPVVVDPDATRLSQVFSNLLNNAANFRARGTT